MTRATRPLALFGATDAAVALAACGGTTVSDDVPANPPAIVPVLTNGSLDTAPASSSSNSSPANGATAGGGLTVIANAPNPAGQSILRRFFTGGVSPFRLFVAALPATLVVSAAFLLL